MHYSLPEFQFHALLSVHIKFAAQSLIFFHWVTHSGYVMSGWIQRIRRRPSVQFFQCNADQASNTFNFLQGINDFGVRYFQLVNLHFLWVEILIDDFIFITALQSKNKNLLHNFLVAVVPSCIQ